MKLTKVKIEELVNEIETFLKENEIIVDVCIYFNNKRRLWESDRKNDWRPKLTVEEDICPFDYFEYVNPKHILSMSFEGALYHILNGYDSYADRMQQKFSAILKKYGLWYELGQSWNLSCYLINDDMEVEYTDYTEDIKPEPEFIFLGKDNIPTELKAIMRLWFTMSKATGDKGACVIGAGFTFEWEGKTYKMAACSPWQGELSWIPHVEKIRELLIAIGAENVVWNCGRMD